MLEFFKNSTMGESAGIKNNNVGDGINVNYPFWTFGGDTNKMFEGHIKRSIPFYDEGHELIFRLSDFFISPKSICYDLGCSTGTLTIKLFEHNKEKKDIKFIGIEIEENMVKKALEKAADLKNVEIIPGDISVFSYEPADMFISYYTIQFLLLRPKARQKMIDTVYRRLNLGGRFYNV